MWGVRLTRNLCGHQDTAKKGTPTTHIGLSSRPDSKRAPCMVPGALSWYPSMVSEPSETIPSGLKIFEQACTRVSFSRARACVVCWGGGRGEEESGITMSTKVILIQTLRLACIARSTVDGRRTQQGTLASASHARNRVT